MAGATTSSDFRGFDLTLLIDEGSSATTGGHVGKWQSWRQIHQSDEAVVLSIARQLLNNSTFYSMPWVHFDALGGQISIAFTYEPSVASAFQLPCSKIPARQSQLPNAYSATSVPEEGSVEGRDDVVDNNIEGQVLTKHPSTSGASNNLLLSINNLHIHPPLPLPLSLLPTDPSLPTTSHFWISTYKLKQQPTSQCPPPSCHPWSRPSVQLRTSWQR